MRTSGSERSRLPPPIPQSDLLAFRRRFGATGRRVMAGSFWIRWSPFFLSLLRAVAGFLFMQHGMEKLFGFPAGGHTVHLLSLMGLAGVLECFGGGLVLLGLFTRPIAF